MKATRSLSAILAVLLACASNALAAQDKKPALEQDVTQGALRVVQKDGGILECPLKHTDVKADISGFIARVKVTQTFHNPLQEKIEAVYVFPLPHEAAVDEMTMVIGNRRIVGLIKRRAEARQIYEQALAAGATAALLEQERPNLFTQSVGNIEPGQDVQIEISYVDVLKYDLGVYEFHFPVVVGPRYNPGAPIASPPPVPGLPAGAVSPPQPDTTRVPDASRITPPYMKPEFRNGHDISLSVNLDAGVPIQDLKVSNHKVDTVLKGKTAATVKIKDEDSIPNKDFVLRYAVVGTKPEMAILAHRPPDAKDDGYFMLMVQPKEDERLTKSPPREMVFLVDVSGSMSGQPTAKCIEMMQGMLKLCRGQDTVQVITFANAATKLFEKPLPVNDQNIQRALNFTSGLAGGGGTEMLKGIKLAIDEPIDKERLRIIVMLTDGFIGNEAEIIDAVGKGCGDQIRFWCVGIGSAPNMFLVDGVAKQGGGMGKKLALTDDSTALSQEIMTRIQRAQLAKVKIDWGKLKVTETYPARIPELWAGRPIIVFGRYAGGGDTVITVSGNVEGQDASWPLAVTLPDRQGDHDVLAPVWARQKIEDLMQQTYYEGTPAVEQAVTALALQYKLMSQYTSFVAVDEKDAAGLKDTCMPPRRMLVPLPIPQGTSWEGFFGEEKLETSTHGLMMLREGAGELTNSISFDGYGLGGMSLARREQQSARMAGAQGGGAGGRGGRGSGGFGGGGGAGGASASASGFLVAGNMPASAGAPPAAMPSPVLAAQKTAMAPVLSPPEPAGPATQPVDRTYTVSALQRQSQPLVTAAQDALKAAKEAADKNLWPEACQQYGRALVLAVAIMNLGMSDQRVLITAQTGLEEARRQQVKSWAKTLPALDGKLDLVLRDVSLSDALKKLGANIDILDGSFADAQSLLDRGELRVTWLDLRHATLSQALDWLLLPNRLSWWVEKDRIVVGSDRRRTAEQWAWVYDVSTIAVPAQTELTGNYNEQVAAAQKAADSFITPLRQSLKVTDVASVAWFAPGRILVIGDASRHAAAAKLLADLTDPKSKLDGALGDLHKLALTRTEQRKADVAAAKALRQRQELADVFDRYAWQLLASAANGQVDDESLTELKIAFASPLTPDLLKGPQRAMVLRAWWAVMDSARTLPGFAVPVPTDPLPARVAPPVPPTGFAEDLREQGPMRNDQAKLGELATALCTPAAKAALEALTKTPEVKTPEARQAYVSVLYGALALRSDAAFIAKARPLLTAKQTDATLAKPGLLADALLGPAAPSSATTAEGFLKDGVVGDDMVVLTALACRRAGGAAWESFRAASADLLGGQPLSGEVVVLVNSLSPGRLTMLK